MDKRGDLVRRNDEVDFHPADDLLRHIRHIGRRRVLHNRKPSPFLHILHPFGAIGIGAGQQQANKPRTENIRGRTKSHIDTGPAKMNPFGIIQRKAMVLFQQHMVVGRAKIDSAGMKRVLLPVEV